MASLNVSDFVQLFYSIRSYLAQGLSFSDIVSQLSNYDQNSVQSIYNSIITGIADESTLLYFRGQILQHPVKYLVFDRKPEQSTYEWIENSVGIFNKVKDLIEQKYTLSDIIEAVPDFSVIDIYNVYYWLIKDDETINNEDFLADINKILRSNRLNTIPTIALLEARFEGWLNNFNKAFEADTKVLTEMLSQQQELLSYSDQPTFYSPITITTISLAIKLDVPDNIDPLDIFNNVNMSYNMPYLRYVKNWNNDEVYTKIYNGLSPETRPDYDNIIWLPGKIKDGFIYFTIWINMDGDDPTKAIKKSYVQGKYNTNDQTIYIKVNMQREEDAQNTKIVVENISQGFNRAIISVKEVSIGGNFKLFSSPDPIVDPQTKQSYKFPSPTYDKITLVYLLMNIPIYANYFNIRERDNTLAGKDRFKIHYRNINIPAELAQLINISKGSLNMNVKSISKSSTNFKIETLQGDTVKQHFNAGDTYIDVTLSGVTTVDTLNNIRTIFRLLMNRYLLVDRQNIINLYNNILPEILPRLIPEVEIPKVKDSIKEDEMLSVDDMPSMIANKIWTRPKEHIDLLRRVAPDIFPHNYSRFNNKNPPIIIKPDEIELWTSQIIPGTNIKQQILPFPKDNPKFYFGCAYYPSSDGHYYPYPGAKEVKPSHELKYNGQPIPYKFLPSCYARDQIKNQKKGFKNYYLSKFDQVETTRVLNDRKILPPGRFGTVLPQLAEVLTNFRAELKQQDGEFTRLGVVYDPNSFIHCIMQAMYFYYATNINTPNIDLSLYYTLYLPYNNLTDEQKSEFAKTIRLNIADTIRPETYKQEMYETPYDEIDRYVRDVSTFFDPSLLYRALEEKFNINIYVFSHNLEDDSVYLDMPKFKISPIRINRPERFTIIIFKYKGNRSNLFKIPQCDLIVYKSNGTIYSTVYNQIMTDYLYKLSQLVLKTNTWSIINGQDVDQLDISSKSINTPLPRISINRYDVFNQISLYSILTKTVSIKYQIIDSMGKQRGFVTQDDIMIIGLPGQPENLPAIDHNMPTNVDKALNLFNNPLQGIDKRNGHIHGLWYAISNIKFGLYIPIEPIDESNSYYQDLLTYDHGPINPVFNDSVNYNKLFNKYKHQRIIILSFIYWLYIINRQNIDQTLDLLSPPIDGGLKSYDMTNVPQSLPDMTDISQAILYITGVVPDLIYQDKIYCYSQKLYKDLRFFLKDLAKNTEGLKLSKPKYIDNYFVGNMGQIKSSPNTLVFNTYTSFLDWNVERSEKIDQFNAIYTKLDLQLALRIEPYIYQSPENKTYIIQNVVKGDLQRAITVAYNWYMKKINIGFSSPEYDQLANYPNYIIYGISTKSTMVPIENKSQGERHVNILRYNNTYAAILPLF